MAVLTSSQEFFEAAIALKIFSNNYNNGRKFKINLVKSGFKKTSYSVSKWNKHGLTSLVVAGNDPPVDINIFVDVSRNPGPVSSVSNLLLQDAASASNLHVCSTITIYTRSELFNLCRVSDTSLPAPILFELKNSGILRYRGCRAGRRKIPTIISSDDIRIALTSLASLRTGVVRSNLISIPLRAPPEFVHRRQLCNFTLVNARSIRNKTLMLNDFIVEHDVDIFAITETWLRDSDFDDFFCSDICPAGYNFFHDPRTTSHGGGVTVLIKKPFKVVKQQQLANFKSFEAYEAVLKSSGNYNLKLVNIYRPPPSTANGLIVALFLVFFFYISRALKLGPWSSVDVW